jgi:hypothetical protein
MLSTNKPLCPRCAHSEAELISNRLNFRTSDKTKQHPYSTTYALQCQCGAAFTHDVPIEVESRQPV